MTVEKPAVSGWMEKVRGTIPDLELRHLAKPETLPGDVKSVLRGWAEESLHFFTVMVLGYDLLGGEGTFHWRMCEWLEEARKAQLLLCYRGGYKSTVGTIAYPIWKAAKDAEHYSHMELVSDMNLGRQMMTSLRNRVDKHGRLLRALFPEMVPANTGKMQSWRGDVASLATRTDDGPTWQVRTMGQGRAGRHITDIGMDDIVNEVNYPSRTDQDELKAQLDYIWPTLNEDVVIAKGTRYTDYDFWGYMIELLWPDELDVWVQPVRGTASLDSEGNVVIEDSDVYAHPEQWNDRKIKSLERKTRDPHVFHCQYFLDTTQTGARMIEKDWVKYAEMGALPAVTYYMACDPASGKGTSNPAIVVVGIEADRTIHVVHTDDEFGSEADFLEAILTCYRQFLPSVVGIESYGQGGKSMQQQVAAKCQNENEWLPVEYLTHGHLDKDSHIRQTLQPQYQWGAMRHLVTLRGGHFEEQLFSFPHGKLLDLLDALAYAVGLSLKYGADYVPAPGESRERTRGPLNVERAYSLETLLSTPDLPEEEVPENAGVW